MLMALITLANLKTEVVTAQTTSGIESLANQKGAVRIAFSFGEVWRKMGAEWVVMS